jgi:hypothetical protein
VKFDTGCSDKIAVNYLHKSQVVMYICKQIHIEGIAMFEYGETVPFPRYDWPKSRYQMYTTND